MAVLIMGHPLGNVGHLRLPTQLLLDARSVDVPRSSNPFCVSSVILAVVIFHGRIHELCVADTQLRRRPWHPARAATLSPHASLPSKGTSRDSR